MSDSMSAFRLSEDQWCQFDRDGYLVVEDLFTAEELQPVIEEIAAEIEQRVQPLVQSGELSRDYAEYGFEHRLAKITAETDQIALALWNGALAGPAVFDLIRHPNLL